MATIPELEARIHALWATGDARTRDESVELGRLLTALATEMPPGIFIRMSSLSSTCPRARRSANRANTAYTPVRS